MSSLPDREALIQIAHGVAAQFGPNCEVVVYDLTQGDIEHSIVAIENGHVTGRKVGDGPSQAMLDAVRDLEHLGDRMCYLAHTKDGKILKSTTCYLRDENGVPVGIFAINFDITFLLAAENQLQQFTTTDSRERPQEPAFHHVTNLLEELIEQSVKLAGKPVAMMSKEDKIKAIRFLNEAGAFLITKSGDRVCQYFGISKYTLYSYLGEAKG